MPLSTVFGSRDSAGVSEELSHPLTGFPGVLQGSVLRRFGRLEEVRRRFGEGQRKVGEGSEKVGEGWRRLEEVPRKSEKV